jgi:hypothetical protein
MTSTPDLRNRLDPREPRLTAALSTAVLAAGALTVATPVGVTLLALQSLVFALGAFGGLRVQPYGALARAVVLPRLAPRQPVASEPFRFAQIVGLIFTLTGCLLAAFQQPMVALFFIALALAGTFLSAAFNYCIGCDLYLSVRRTRSSG